MNTKSNTKPETSQQPQANTSLEDMFMEEQIISSIKLIARTTTIDIIVNMLNAIINVLTSEGKVVTDAEIKTIQEQVEKEASVSNALLDRMGTTAAQIFGLVPRNATQEKPTSKTPKEAK